MRNGSTARAKCWRGWELLFGADEADKDGKLREILLLSGL